MFALKTSRQIFNIFAFQFSKKKKEKNRKRKHSIGF